MDRLDEANLREARQALKQIARDLQGDAVDFLRRQGYVRCDIPACNCGSWHAREGYYARFREIEEAVGGHQNGKTLLRIVEENVSDLSEAVALLRSGRHNPGPGPHQPEWDARKAALLAKHPEQP